MWARRDGRRSRLLVDHIRHPCFRRRRSRKLHLLFFRSPWHKDTNAVRAHSSRNDRGAFQRESLSVLWFSLPLGIDPDRNRLSKTHQQPLGLPAKLSSPRQQPGSHTIQVSRPTTNPNLSSPLVDRPYVPPDFSIPEVVLASSGPQEFRSDVFVIEGEFEIAAANSPCVTPRTQSRTRKTIKMAPNWQGNPLYNIPRADRGPDDRLPSSRHLRTRYGSYFV
jgi:hypothetical protein